MIKIEKLNSKNIENVLTVTNMMYEWWGKESYISYELMKEIIISYCSNEDFPIVLIAKENENIIGTISLVSNDTQLRQDLYPVMSSLFIKEEYRNKGIGSKLVQEMINLAKEKFNKVYLLTHLDGYYERFGFQYIETTKAFIDLKNNQPALDRLYVLEF